MPGPPARRRSAILLLPLFAAALAACSPASNDPLIMRAGAFVDAFNARDAAAMGALAHAEIEWLSASDSELSAGTIGREALLAEMSGYFDADFSTRSEMFDTTRHGNFVTATEAASWQGKNGAQRQCSMVVYEFADDLIRRVTYYPAYAC